MKRCSTNDLYTSGKHMGLTMYTPIAVLCLCSLECRAEKIDFWDNVYGFNMSSIREIAITEPLVDTVDAQQVATQPCLIKHIDILTMTKSDATFEVRLELLWLLGLHAIYSSASSSDQLQELIASSDCTQFWWHKNQPAVLQVC